MYKLGAITYKTLRAVAKVSEKKGVSYDTLRKRVNRGWSLKEAVYTPMGVRRTA